MFLTEKKNNFNCFFLKKFNNIIKILYILQNYDELGCTSVSRISGKAVFV